MSNILNTASENNYWSKRYEEQRTGWDIGFPSSPLKTYIDQLENKDLHILIPGAGNAYEVEYLFLNGFKNVYVLDISPIPLEIFQKRNPSFHSNQLLHQNFFEHTGQYDLILEQTFFCSFEPTVENRTLYGKRMSESLKSNGKLVGLWFNHPLEKKSDKRPFGGSKKEYSNYLSPFFNIVTFEDCYNSIKARAEKELFGIFSKK